MRVQDIYKLMIDSELITLFDNTVLKYLWHGEVENIPLEYMDCKIEGMYTSTFNFTESELIILIA